MPAYFENGVFANATPAWHGLGVVVEDETITSQRIYELVPELGSEIVKTPLFAAYSDGEGFHAPTTERYFANVRAVDRKIVGVVGQRYELIQPRETFAFGEAVVDQGGLWETAGSLNDGSTIWGLLKLPGEIHIGDADDELMVPYLMLSNSYDGSSKFTALTTWVRVVCWNTWTMAMATAPHKFQLTHTESATGRLQEARDALKLSFKLGSEIKALGDALISRQMTDRELTRFLTQLLPTPEKTGDTKEDAAMTQAVRDQRFDVRKVITESPNLQNVAGTAWAALQGTLEYTQRYEAPRASAASVFKRTTFTPSPLNTRALSLLAA